MKILSSLFSRKKSKYEFFETAFGYEMAGVGDYEAIGVVVFEVYYNLYEDQFGNRKSKRFCGQEMNDIVPEDADFSVTAQVDAWVAGGPVPSCLFDPLGSKKINKHKTKNPRLVKGGEWYYEFKNER